MQTYTTVVPVLNLRSPFLPDFTKKKLEIAALSGLGAGGGSIIQ
jgi:hypothetical protein